jgi:hypothetical protein
MIVSKRQDLIPAMRFQRGMRALLLIAIIGLTGCVASNEQLLTRLNTKYVGQSVDAMVNQYGPPASTFKMSSGETSYMWQSNDVQRVNCKISAIAAPTGLVTKVSIYAASYIDGESFCAGYFH